MTLGVVGAATTVAHAASPLTNNWYVAPAPTGNDTGNACANSGTPCATIAHAIYEQGLTGLAGTIHLAQGLYTEAVTVGNLQDGVTIAGAGATKSTIEPSATEIANETPAGDTDSSNPQFYVVGVSPGTTGFKIKNLTVSGIDGIPALDSDGDGCAQDYVGVYYYSSSGTISHVDINGIDMPTDLYGCQGGNGVYVNSTEGANTEADVNILDVSLLTSPVTTKTTAKLLAGTYSNDVLPVSAVPGGWHSGEVTVGGYDVSATKDGHTALFITGTTPGVAPKGSTVRFYVTTPAYSKNGILCDDQYTTCAIRGAVIQGDGPENTISPNGVKFVGTGTATINGSTISGNVYTGGGSGNSADGILARNVGALTVGEGSANTVSGNDVNIYAGEVPAYGLATSEGLWNISNNVLSDATDEGQSAGGDGYGEGIYLDGSNNQVGVYNNTITTSGQAGMLLTGVSESLIGGTGAGQPNTIQSNKAGLVLAGPSTQCEVSGGGAPPTSGCNPGYPFYGSNPPSPGWGSNDNTVSGNIVGGLGGLGNLAGVVVDGYFVPPNNLGLSSAPNVAYNNSFLHNTWSGESTGPPPMFESYNTLADIIDFSGSADTPPVADTYGATNSCTPSPGGSASADDFLGANETDSGVTLTAGSPATASMAGSFGAGAEDGGLVVDTTTPGNIPADTYVTSGEGTNTLDLSNDVTAASSDTLAFYDVWAC
jgi:hypothetical protein